MAFVAFVVLVAPATASAVTEQFPFVDGNGAPFQFTVPFDVTHVTIDAVGAKGLGPSGGTGGLGGEAIGSFVFTSSEDLQFDMGGDGGSCATPDAPNGGWNGGASGGVGCGGGGGGATDVRTGTCASNLTCGTGNIIIIAGGGGGQGSDNEAGGTGGGPNGGNGADGFNGVQNGTGGGGQGATQTMGGAGGVAGVGNNPIRGGDGVALQGGAGSRDGCSGGGGGGGWFGGGGGGSSGGNGCGGGGGGSSFVTAGGTGATYHSGVTGTIGGGEITLTFLYDTITTSGPAAAAVAQNANVNDAVTVSGNNTDTPTGKVQFAICGPFQTAVGCSQASGTALASATLSPNHDTNNTASTSSASISEAKIGTYCFFANYVGDVNYNPSIDGSAEECFAVRGPSVTTSSPTKSTIQLGDTNTDGATSSGDGVTPTGTTQFLGLRAHGIELHQRRQRGRSRHPLGRHDDQPGLHADRARLVVLPRRLPG